MSRGPGWVERRIAEIFAENPAECFSVLTLCRMVWPGANRIEHKHRVSVVRAATRISERTKWTKFVCPDWCSDRGIVLFIGPKFEQLEEYAAAAKWSLPTEQEVQFLIRVGEKINFPTFKPSAKSLGYTWGGVSVSGVRRAFRAARAG
jgi:hypothetical protein